MAERLVEPHKRGTVEYRVRWRRGPVEQGWRTRLFQQLDAAKQFAAFLVRENPMYRIREPMADDSVANLDESIAPVLECVIQIREVGPWSDTDVDPKTVMRYRRRQPEWP